MTRSATDVMHDVLVAAVIEAIMAAKAASKGIPNTLLRDLSAIHANTTFADLPKELQASINANVRSAFTRLLKEGYVVTAERSPQRTAPVISRPDRPQRAPSSNGDRSHRPRSSGPRPKRPPKEP
jgi:hypothetical protein